MAAVDKDGRLCYLLHVWRELKPLAELLSMSPKRIVDMEVDFLLKEIFKNMDEALENLRKVAKNMSIKKLDIKE